MLVVGLLRAFVKILITVNKYKYIVNYVGYFDENLILENKTIPYFYKIFGIWDVLSFDFSLH